MLFGHPRSSTRPLPRRTSTNLGDGDMSDGTQAPRPAQERISHIAGRPPLPVPRGDRRAPLPHRPPREIETRLYALDDASRALCLAVAEAGAQIDALASRLDDPAASGGSRRGRRRPRPQEVRRGRRPQELEGSGSLPPDAAAVRRSIAGSADTRRAPTVVSAEPDGAAVMGHTSTPRIRDPGARATSSSLAPSSSVASSPGR